MENVIQAQRDQAKRWMIEANYTELSDEEVTEGMNTIEMSDYGKQQRFFTIDHDDS